MRIWSSAGVALAFSVGAWMPATLQAACRSPLPTESLRALDDRIDVDPAGVLREAQRRLDALHGSDDFQAAELNALVADADSLSDDDAQARIAIAGSRAYLLRLPDSESKRSDARAGTFACADRDGVTLLCVVARRRRADHCKPSPRRLSLRPR